MYLICKGCKSLVAKFCCSDKSKKIKKITDSNVIYASMDELRSIEHLMRKLYPGRDHHIRDGAAWGVEKWLYRFRSDASYWIGDDQCAIVEDILLIRANSIYQCDHTSNFIKEDSEEEGCTVFSPRNYPDVVY